MRRSKLCNHADKGNSHVAMQTPPSHSSTPHFSLSLSLSHSLSLSLSEHHVGVSTALLPFLSQQLQNQRKKTCMSPKLNPCPQTIQLPQTIHLLFRNTHSPPAALKRNLLASFSSPSLKHRAPPSCRGSHQRSHT